jgi:hypothetical protein
MPPMKMLPVALATHSSIPVQRGLRVPSLARRCFYADVRLLLTACGILVTVARWIAARSDADPCDASAVRQRAITLSLRRRIT